MMVTGIRPVFEDDFSISIDDEVYDFENHLSFEDTPLANCTGVFIRTLIPAKDFLESRASPDLEFKRSGEVAKETMMYDGVFLDYNPDLKVTAHIIRPDLILFFISKEVSSSEDRD